MKLGHTKNCTWNFELSEANMHLFGWKWQSYPTCWESKTWVTQVLLRIVKQQEWGCWVLGFWKKRQMKYKIPVVQNDNKINIFHIPSSRQWPHFLFVPPPVFPAALYPPLLDWLPPLPPPWYPPLLPPTPVLCPGGSFWSWSAHRKKPQLWSRGFGQAKNSMPLFAPSFCTVNLRMYNIIISLWLMSKKLNLTLAQT